jgi:hypothetical protein
MKEKSYPPSAIWEKRGKTFSLHLAAVQSEGKL